MNKPITYVAILIAVVIAFFSFQKFSQRNITSEKSTLIQAEPEVTVKNLPI